ncbi:MAG: ABC transporter permease [Thermomicrobiales bacterium]
MSARGTVQTIARSGSYATAGDRLSIFLRRVGPIWSAVLVLYVVAGIKEPAMLQTSQLFNILQVAAFLGCIAIGQTIALLVGGIDLSVAGVVTLTNIVVARLMAGSSDRIVQAVGACLILAIVVGLINGFVITKLGITPLIVTLATNSILFGAALVYTHGAPSGSVAEPFAQLGQGHISRFPVSTLVWIGLTCLMAFVLTQTVFGRRLYAVGANPNAARLMGVPTDRTITSAYVLCSLMACAGGLLITAYIGLPSLGIGNQFMLTSIAAAVVGGTMLTGGVGSVIGAAGGALFIQVLNSFTNMLTDSTGVQFIIQGIIIALGVMLYPALSGRSGRR